MQSQEHEKYMKRALELARQSFDEGEVPVGCVIANSEGVIIGEGRNRREALKSPLSHAEIHAIDMACKNIGDWRLQGCTIFISLEPCPMCVGAIINARIPTVVFAAREENSGCAGSVIDLFSENLGHKPRVYTGILAEESKALLKAFFEKIRGLD